MSTMHHATTSSKISSTLDDDDDNNNNVNDDDVNTMIHHGDTSGASGIRDAIEPPMDGSDDIVLERPIPFRWTRRRDRWYGSCVIILVVAVTLGIALLLTKENRENVKSDTSNVKKEWMLIGDEISNSEFQEDEILGISLALSDDGQIIAVGNRHTPQVRLYTYEATWVQLGADIVGNDDAFGYDVALSGDGRTVAIGGPKHSAVYVYKFNETKEWDLVGGSIRGDMSRGELAGSAISLSWDGRVIAIGAHLNSDSFQRSGQVRAFQLSSDDTEWEQLGSDINGDAFADQFGGAVSLSNDGYTLAVGARFHDDDADSVTNRTNIGHVRVYRFDEDGWSVIGNDIEGDEAEEGFGYSVSLSGDGRTCAIGNTNSELAVVRRSETDEWLSIGSSIPPTSMDEGFFSYVSLSRDGNVLAVLEYRSYNGGALPTVIVFRYDEAESMWTQVGSALTGAGLALSADGSIVAVGGVNVEGLEYVRVLTVA